MLSSGFEGLRFLFAYFWFEGLWGFEGLLSFGFEGLRFVFAYFVVFWV